jgi:hypothetical protein
MLSDTLPQCSAQTNGVLRAFHALPDVKLKLVFDVESVFAIIELAGMERQDEWVSRH